MSYIGNIPVPQATQTRDNFTATEGQTSFATSGYSPGYVDVYLNGIHLDPSDYTATDGNAVVLSSGATSGDVVSIVAFSTFTVAGNVTGDVNNTTIVTEDVTVSGQAIGTITTDNDLSFDMTAGNNFKCTVAANGTLTFTNITSGQSGNIWLDNSGGYTISAASSTLIAAADLTTLSTAGVYFMSYYSDGTNVAVSVTPGVTSGGA
jgi:hypothetical protein